MEAVNNDVRTALEMVRWRVFFDIGRGTAGSVDELVHGALPPQGSVVRPAALSPTALSPTALSPSVMWIDMYRDVERVVGGPWLS